MAASRLDGEIVERRLMTLTLGCDHRILYGADAARFCPTSARCSSSRCA